MSRPIYLDYNGTTPIDPEVLDAMMPFLTGEFGNPSSSHWYGIAPKRAVEAARLRVASLIGCEPGEIIFTSGGTESNNHAILGTARSLRDRGRHIVTSAVEHPAVLEVCRRLEREGFETTKVGVDGYGMVDPSDVGKAIRADTVLISIMHANNEVGTIQPVSAIAKIARARGIAMHTDAAQSLGKIPVHVRDLGVDLLTIAGHKLYAPKGVGALYIRGGAAPEKFCYGAGQERGWRAGTENVAGIVGLGMACEMARKDIEGAMSRVTKLRDSFHAAIAERVGEVRLNGHPERRLPNTLSLSFRGHNATRLLEELGIEVAASAGAACHADSVTVSHVLAAMRVPEEWARGTLRFSLGRMTTEEEIDRASEAVAEAVRRVNL